MDEGTLAKWLGKERDSVSSGDILAEIETDKATMEFEAVDEGTIAKILVPEGTDEVKVGTVIAVMTGEGEDASATSAAPKEEAKAPAAEPKEQADVPAPESAEPHQMETGARDLVAAAEKNEVKDPDRPEGPRRVRMTVPEGPR